MARMMAKLRAGAGLALLLGAGACSHPGPAARDDQLSRELAAIAADPVFGMASLSVLAVRGGKVSYQGQFGTRSMDAELPAGPQTMYRIASISKLVTTLGVMRLVEQGKLDLDADVGDYLGYALRNPVHPDAPVTLRMLLSHTSSLRDEGGYSWGPGTSLRQAMADSAGKWDARAPGRYFAYSNLNFGVVGTVMEAVSGERFDRLMDKLVLAPLGLKGGYNVSEMPREQWRQVATLYRKRPSAGGPWNPQGPWFAQVDDFSVQSPAAPAGIGAYVPGTNGTVFSPTGGLRLSARDLGTIMAMMMDEGRHAGQAFLKPSTLASMLSRQWRYDPARPNGDTHHGLFSEWGLGVQHFEARAGRGASLVEGGGFRASGHLGEAYGLLSVFAFDQLRRDGMIVLIGGTASDPAATPGKYSALSRQEELVLTALHRHLASSH